MHIVANEKIVEFDSGIIAGNTREQIAKKYPEYYKIWLERKDLDGIPNAEKGSELQARVLAFLMEYYDKEEFVDIVVSHAGFLRCLINTSRGMPRTTPVNSKNGAINIIDWEGLGLYPAEYQLASFLVSAILLEGYSANETMKIAREIEPELDEGFITYLMKFRIFKGLHFFVENRNIYTKSNQKVSNEILKKNFYAAEKLNRYIEKRYYINTEEREL